MAALVANAAQPAPRRARSARQADVDRLLAFVPGALRELPRWVVWKLVPTPGEAKPRKIPYYARTGAPRSGTQGSEDDRAQLVDFDEAVARFAAGGWEGIGFCPLPGDDVVLIDFDSCVDGHGVIDGEVLSITRDTYREISHSGRGVHAVFVGQLAQGKAGAGMAGGVEIFCTSGYVAITGRSIGDEARAAARLDDDAGVLALLLKRFERARGAGEEKQPGSERGWVHVDATVVADLRSALNALDADDRDTWVGVGHDLYELGPVVGRELWLTWSQQSAKHNPTKDPQKWETFKNAKSGYGNVFKRAQELGWANPSRGRNAENNPPPHRATEDTLPLVWARDADHVPDTDYIIKGVVNVGELVVIYGNPKGGKTFLALDLALSATVGRTWFGHRVHAGPTIYIACEMGPRILRRVVAWRDERMAGASPDIPFACVPARVNLTRDQDVNRLFATVDLMVASGVHPRLLVIDTLARSMAGADENDAESMGRAISVADGLRDRFGIATLLVHHSGKDASKGMRGSSALLGAVDAVIKVTQDAPAMGKGARYAEIEWSRDGEAGRRLHFDLSVVRLGTDADGEDITTCVVTEETGAAQGAAAAPRRLRLPKGTEVCFAALREAVSENGAALPATSAIPAGVQAVTLDTWRSAYYVRAPLNVDPSADKHERDKAGDTRLKAFGRMRDALQASGQVGICNSFVWIHNLGGQDS